MTEQTPDTCVLNGRLWDIVDFQGNVEVIPTNDILGISTATESSANWSGRIDHYLIFHDSLYLFKIRVFMPDNSKDHIPRKARREVITRTERLMRTDDKGIRRVFQDYRVTNLIFDDLLVYFTGTLLLNYPSCDPWDYPETAFQEEDLSYSEKAIVTLESGKVVDIEIEDI